MKGLRRGLLIGAGLVFPALLVFVATQGFIVRNAVVTAELVELRTPIDGVLAELSVRRGQYLAGGGPAARIEDPRADRRALEALGLAVAQSRQALAARQAELAALEAAIAAIELRSPAQTAGLRADLALQQQIALAERSGIEARIAFLTKQSDRARRLQGSAASQASLESAEADLAAAEASLQAIDLEIERLAQQQDYLDRGLLVTEMTDGAVTLANSRLMLETRQRVAQVETALLEATLAMQEAQLGSEQEHFDLRAEALLDLPPDSAVWEVLASQGTTVVAGLPLLTYVSCGSRFVEAAVDDSTVELLGYLNPVEVTLYGTDAPLPGRVIAAYGSAGRLSQQQSVAAHVGELGASDALVLIEIAGPPVEARDHRLCDVGRTAYVKFEGIGLLDPLLNRLF